MLKKVFSPTLFLHKKALEPNPNIYKYFWDLPGAAAQKYLSSSRLDPLSLNNRSWLKCVWKLWTSNRSLCMQSGVGSSSVFMCSGHTVKFKKSPRTTNLFCYIERPLNISGHSWYHLVYFRSLSSGASSPVTFGTVGWAWRWQAQRFPLHSSLQGCVFWYPHLSILF